MARHIARMATRSSSVTCLLGVADKMIACFEGCQMRVSAWGIELRRTL